MARVGNAIDSHSYTSVATTANTVTFPQEILDAIIDHLYDDPVTLQRCSLVCKSWEPSSTYHLFFSWSWPPSIKFMSADTSLARCLDHLSSSPRICSSIRRLRIRRSFELNPKTSPAPRNTRRLLLRILDLLPSLRVLHCSQLEVRQSKKDAVGSSRVGLRSLSKLYISESGPHSLSTAALLCLFHGVDRLIVDGALGRSALSPDLKPHRTAARSLHVGSAWKDNLGDILHMLQARLDLTVLDT